MRIHRPHVHKRRSGQATEHEDDGHQVLADDAQARHGLASRPGWPFTPPSMEFSIAIMPRCGRPSISYRPAPCPCCSPASGSCSAASARDLLQGLLGEGTGGGEVGCRYGCSGTVSILGAVEGERPRPRDRTDARRHQPRRPRRLRASFADDAVLRDWGQEFEAGATGLRAGTECYNIGWRRTPRRSEDWTRATSGS